MKVFREAERLITWGRAPAGYPAGGICTFSCGHRQTSYKSSQLLEWDGLLVGKRFNSRGARVFCRECTEEQNSLDST